MIVKLYRKSVYVADTINEEYSFEQGYEVYNIDDTVTQFLAGIDIEDSTGKSISIRSNNICVIDLRNN
jgi:hypothetical protein